MSSASGASWEARFPPHPSPLPAFAEASEGQAPPDKASGGRPRLRQGSRGQAPLGEGVAAGVG